MQVSEMHLLYKVELDKVDTLSYPDFTPNEIDLILNTTQDLVAVQRYKEFEVTQKRIDDIRTLVTPDYSCPIIAISATQYTATLPADYWFKLRTTAIGTGTVCGVSASITLDNVQTTHDRIDKMLKDPFNKPDTTKCLLLFDGSNITIYTDGTVITSLMLTYLRKPLRLSLSATGVNTPVGYTNTCELPDHIHREIVSVAVRRTLEMVESVRYPNNRQEPIE